ncbi:MAG: HPF/RaiA family ribosome-associated protein [Sinimarinibacterium sp.]|jgi:ribosomal subunit interface protein
MQIPLQITFRNMDPSPAVEARIRSLAERLERFDQDVVSCRVVVEMQSRHQHQGNLYHVGIDLRTPGAEFASGRGATPHHAHEDVYVAIRDAFDSLRRQLEEQVRRRRGDVKAHDTPPHGRVAELTPDYGQIETSDGRRIYFHRNSVVDGDFDSLGVGDEVRFAEEAGELGPQATTVHTVGKHHIVG